MAWIDEFSNDRCTIHGIRIGLCLQFMHLATLPLNGRRVIGHVEIDVIDQHAFDGLANVMPRCPNGMGPVFAGSLILITINKYLNNHGIAFCRFGCPNPSFKS